MNDEDLLDFLCDQGCLSEEQAALTLDTRASYGGTLLRTLERLFTPAEVITLWGNMAKSVERRYYTAGNQIETIEEPWRGSGGWEPLISRPVSCHHLLLAQRTEWDVLSVISVNPFIDLSARDLWERAQEVSPTGKGRLKASVIPPVLFRKCFGFTYPEGLYGPLRLTERLSVQGLCPLGSLETYSTKESEAVKDGLIGEDDYALCISQHLELPLYNYTKPEIDWRILPENLIRRLNVLPLRVDQGHIEILSSAPPSPQATQEIQRQSGLRARYLITTPTVIQRLMSQRELYVKNQSV